ncbi:hypothetical protein LO762_16730 [Actinocorallia sp. API 0066]|uniref:hypothetical protein n=1 Tax=Actinocorallia sp. API 0066 TaxID=2896846 RepID=UPI001E543689|nr:hypothetical protein [Actinocorallia sp. API 0066]MCD0450825.1 hypothetical protein [Actinocorallia sp. API 0066]
MTAAAGVLAAEGTVDLFGLSIPWTAMLLFALALFLATGVYSFVRQGLKIAAVVVGVLAVLSVLAAMGRL